ncbi:MAG: NAD(P)-dependent oxidoreductase [Akkermansiaceae bacterium]|nr:NAD(P)-dependent oxidoreductase [Akkermansiaceae bacterium]
MKILLTGASGFVGSSFLRRFADRPGLEIYGTGRRPMAFPNYTRHDLAKPLDLAFTPDVVIHAAARALPWGSPADFHTQNVAATAHVLDFCQRKGVRNFVYLSSSSVFYREADQENMTEATPIGPDFVNDYARTKHEGELLVRDFPGRWVILRPRAVFGPGDTVLFPRLLAAAQAGKMYRFDRPGPPARGDLIYIDTLCEYMLTAATGSSVQGEFNLTNGEPIEIQPFLFGIFEQLGIPLPDKHLSSQRALRIATAIEWFYKVFLPRREPPITRFGIGVLAYSKTFDISKSLAVLGPPAVSLQEGVTAFIRWQKEHLPS